MLKLLGEWHDRLSVLAPQHRTPFSFGEIPCSMISEGGRNLSPSPKRWADSPCLWALAGGAGVWPQLSQRMPHSELGVFREGCKRPEWLEIMHSGGSEIQSLAGPQYPATWCPHQRAWCGNLTELWRIWASLGACSFPEHPSSVFRNSLSYLLLFKEIVFLFKFTQICYRKTSCRLNVCVPPNSYVKA